MGNQPPQSLSQFALYKEATGAQKSASGKPETLSEIAV